MTKITFDAPLSADPGQQEGIVAGIHIELAVEWDDAAGRLVYVAKPADGLPSHVQVIVKGRNGFRRTVSVAIEDAGLQLGKTINRMNFSTKALLRHAAERLQAAEAEYAGTVTDEPIP